MSEETTAEETTAEETTTTTEETTTPEPLSWREEIKDENIRKHAERFDSIESLAKGVYDSRQKLSKAVIPVNEKSTPEEIQAYRKAMGVPESAEGYDVFPEDADPSEVQQWKEFFLEKNVPKGLAKELLDTYGESIKSIQAKIEADDKAFADASEQALRDKWKDEYDVNVEYNRRAAKEMFGDSFEEAAQMQTSDGRLLFDHPMMVEAFARIGREMAEGTLGPVATEGQIQTLTEQANEYRAKARDAMRRGKHAEAKRYDAMERDTLNKIPVT